MKYRFHYGAPLLTRDYVKSILPLIGNIREFEVYGSYDATPYLERTKESAKKYTFILRDDQDNEIWLDTLCGYQGSGPQATKEILQIFGLKDDYKITEKSYIKESNLKPIHCLNLMVATQEFLAPTRKNHFFATLTFTYPSQLHAAKNMFKCFGKFSNYVDGIQLEDDKYFKPFLLSYNEWADYAANNIFIFNPEYETFLTDQLRTIIKTIVIRNKGRLEIQEF